MKLQLFGAIVYCGSGLAWPGEINGDFSLHLLPFH